MSLFGDYIKERQKKEIVEDEDGFATFIINPDGTCYIEDLYVVPSKRGPQPDGKGIASRYADKICEIAKSRGCTKLLGSVVPSLPNSTENVKTLFKYGFVIKSCVNDFILFEKELI